MSFCLKWSMKKIPKFLSSQIHLNMKLLFSTFFRKNGIVIRVTCWQWVMELALTILASFLHIIKGKNRAIEHGLTLFAAGFSYVILPAFYLMADQQFRNNLEKSGLFKAIIKVFTQNQDTNNTHMAIVNMLRAPIFEECRSAPAPCQKEGVPIPHRSSSCPK